MSKLPGDAVSEEPAASAGPGGGEREYRLPDGRRPVAGAVLLRTDGAVLLQHRDDVAGISNPGKWSLFGGGMEPGETPADCLLRELQEEIGAQPASFRPLVVLEGARTVFNLFLARLDTPLDDLVLGEGQGMAFVQPQVALSEYDLAAVARTGLEITVSLLDMRRAQGLATPFDDWGPTPMVRPEA